jgi:hypothetical protein
MEPYADDAETFWKWQGRFFTKLYRKGFDEESCYNMAEAAARWMILKGGA